MKVMEIQQRGSRSKTPRQRARRDRTRKKLLQSSLKVFLSKGVHATRIDDIVSDARTGKGTFYLYFKNKEEVFETLLEEFESELKRTLDWTRNQIDSSQSLEVLFREEGRRIFETLTRHRRLGKLLTRESKGMGPKIKRRFQHMFDELIEISEQTFEFAASLKLLPKFDPRIAAICIVGAIEKVYELWLEGELKQKDEKILEETLSFLVRGVGIR